MPNNLMQQGDTFIESEMPARSGYGQNGSTLPSSLTPGQKIGRSPYAPNPSKAHCIIEDAGMAFDQTLKISSRKAAPAVKGHASRNKPDGKVSTKAALHGGDVRPTTRQPRARGRAAAKNLRAGRHH